MFCETSKVSSQVLIAQAAEAITKIKQMDSHPDWQQFSEQPCQMFRMYVEDRLVSKGKAEIKLPMNKLLNTLTDEQLVKNLNAQLKQVSVLFQFEEKSNKGKINYLSFQGAWPIAGRDFVNVTIAQSTQNIAYIASKKSSYSHPQIEHVVRGTCHIAGYVLRKIDERITQVTYIADIDLAGSIPQTLKNKLIERQACIPKTIEDIFIQYPEETK